MFNSCFLTFYFTLLGQRLNNKPHGNQLENSNVFRCNGQYMDRSSQVGSKSNVMNCICDGHQCLCLGIFPVWHNCQLVKSQRHIDKYIHCWDIYEGFKHHLPRVFVVFIYLNFSSVRYVTVITSNSKHWWVGSRAGWSEKNKRHFFLPININIFKLWPLEIIRNCTENNHMIKCGEK